MKKSARKMLAGLSIPLLLLALLLTSAPQAWAQQPAPKTTPPATPADVRARVTETPVDSSIADDPALDKLLEPLQQLIGLSGAPPLPVDDLWDVDVHWPIVEALRTKDLTAMARALDGHYERLRTTSPREWSELPFRSAARISRENLEGRTDGG